jgi:hypothetical protein
LYNGANGQLVKAMVPPDGAAKKDEAKKDGAKEPKKK